MKPVIRYQSQLLLRKSYKPSRTPWFKVVNPIRISFRPSRGFGSKPRLEIVL